MKNDYANKSIECTVDTCINHCAGDSYCSLKKIHVGTHGRDPSKLANTDCQSFVDRADPRM